jgi:hypothetical protein
MAWWCQDTCLEDVTLGGPGVKPMKTCFKVQMVEVSVPGQVVWLSSPRPSPSLHDELGGLQSVIDEPYEGKYPATR